MEQSVLHPRNKDWCAWWGMRVWNGAYAGRHPARRSCASWSSKNGGSMQCIWRPKENTKTMTFSTIHTICFNLNFFEQMHTNWVLNCWCIVGGWEYQCTEQRRVEKRFWHYARQRARHRATEAAKRHSAPLHKKDITPMISCRRLDQNRVWSHARQISQQGSNTIDATMCHAWVVRLGAHLPDRQNSRHPLTDLQFFWVYQPMPIS